jgi:hypothetical protein
MAGTAAEVGFDPKRTTRVRKVSGHTVQRANLVAVEIAQIGEIKLAHCGFTHPGRILNRRAAGSNASIVPCLDLFRR